MADSGEQMLRFGQHELQMLGRDAVGQLHSLVPVLHQNHRAVAADALPGNGGTRQGQKGLVDRTEHTSGQGAAGGNQDRLGFLVMLGLGQQVQRQMRRVG